MSPAQTEARVSPLALRILAALDDGEWHNLEDVIDAVQYTIPPGEAFRIGQQPAQARSYRRTQDEIIASGRRGKTVNTINSLVSNGRIERRGSKRSEPKYLRLMRTVPQVYVVREADGTLSTYSALRGEEVAIHVIDAWRESDNPKEDARAIQEIRDSIPPRMVGASEVKEACRKLINRLKVAEAFHSLRSGPDPITIPANADAGHDVPDHDHPGGEKGVTHEHD